MRRELPPTVPEKYKTKLYYWMTIRSVKDLPQEPDEDELFICTLTGDDPHSGVIDVFQADYNELATTWDKNDGKISYLAEWAGG